MYHIWTVQCQIQLSAGKRVDRHYFPRFPGCIPVEGGCQLAFAIVAGVGGVDQSPDIVPANRLLDPGKTADRRTGLAGDRERVECGALNQLFRLRGQIASNPQLALESAGKNVALDGLLYGGSG